MDAKCKICGHVTAVARDENGGRPSFECGQCGAKHGAVRGWYFSVPDDAPASSMAGDAEPAASEAPRVINSEQTYQQDLRELAALARASVLPPPPPENVALDAPPSVRAVIRMSAASLIPPPPAPLPSEPAPPVSSSMRPLAPRVRLGRPAKIAIACAAALAGLALIRSMETTVRPSAPLEPVLAQVTFAPTESASAVETASENTKVAEPERAPAQEPAKAVADGSRPAVRAAPFGRGPAGKIKDSAASEPAIPAAPATGAAPEPAAPPAATAAPPPLMEAISNSVGAGSNAPGAAKASPEPGAAPRMPFDRGAASAALASVASSAGSCKRPGVEGGRGGVSVTFLPSGIPSQVTLDAGPFAGTETGQCIVQIFRAARMPPFAGAPVTVHRSFFIN